MLNKVSIAGTNFEKIFGQPLYVEDLPSEETTLEMANMRQNGIAIGKIFSGYVDCLRSSSKLFGQRLADLGKLIWGLNGNRIIPGVIGDTPHNTVSFFTEGIAKDLGIEIKLETKLGVIMIPSNWVSQVRKDSIMQFGAVIFAGSYARDHYNNNYYPDRSLARARGCESEFLYVVRKSDKDWKPNKYQETIMRYYPLGIDSLGELWYESKQFVDPRPGESL